MAGSPKLTQKKGRRLAGGKPIPKSKFALPGGGPGGRDAYPIDTAGRAQNALGKSKRFASPAQQAKIRAAVKRAYPGMEVAGSKPAGKKPAGKKAPFGGKQAPPFGKKKS